MTSESAPFPLPPRRPRWVAVLAGLLLAALTARLGVWQMDRAGQKIHLQQQLERQAAAPLLSGGTLAAGAAEAADQLYRGVELDGRWLENATLYLDNRTMAGVTGFLVLTPLQLPDGSAVLVQRGWVPRHQQDRTRLPAVTTPAGRLRLVARVVPWPSRTYEMGADGQGLIRQNVDREALALAWHVNLRPFSLQQRSAEQLLDAAAPGDPTHSPLARDWPAPAVDVQKHYGYAMQWFGLSALAIGLSLWFGWWRPRQQSRLS